MERLVGLLGLAAMVALAWALSMDRRRIRLKPVIVGLVLQALFALAVLGVPAVQQTFQWLADRATDVIRLSEEGACFLLFGTGTAAAPAVVDTDGASIGFGLLGRLLIVKIIPPIIFFSALTSLLYYLGVLQRVITAMAWVMTRCMGVSGAEALSGAANTMIGMTEAPLLIRPHIAALTRSELFAVMVGGFATSAGGVLALYVSLGIEARFLLAASVMSAPAALAIAKILVPETEMPLTAGMVRATYAARDVNAIDALASGTGMGLRLALNVTAMLISFLAMIALVNALLGWAGTAVLGMDAGALTLQRILGWAFAPLAFLLGVPWTEAADVGQLLGTKVGVNEVVAYSALKDMIARGVLSPRTVGIASFALCGFANFGSIGIQIAGLGAIAPERRGELARFGLRAMAGGALASWMTAALAGLLL